MKPAVSALIERLVGVGFASRCFLDSEDRQHGYRVQQDRSILRGDPATRSARILGRDLDVLVVRRYERFGKNVRQLVNAVAFARRHRIRRVLIPRVDFLELREPVVRGIRFEVHDEEPGRWPRLPGLNALEGNFYFPSDLGMNIAPAVQYAAAHELVIPNLRTALRIPGTDAEKPGWITLHLRSGDVFDERPDPYYGQPPLAFYQKVISVTRARGVVVVHEDRRNPVIAPLLAYCEHRRVPVRLESSSDFQQDLAVLLRARTLVCARGSLALAALLLSRAVERLFSFEMMTLHRAALALGVGSGLMVDMKGQYRDEVLTTWENTAPQRRLMLEYPARHLAWYRRPQPSRP